jgi:hypothetical protein
VVGDFFCTKKSSFLEAMDEDKINSQTKFAARNNTLQSAVSSSDNGNVAV